MKRIAAIVAKEFNELRRSPSIFLPALLTGAAATIYPFVIAIIVPYFAGERLSDSSDFEVATQVFRSQPEARGLTPEGAIQAFVFEYALVLMVGLTTVTGSMAVAAHSVIGEKQARTLEPLLATPVTTFELLAAKVIGAALPGIALMAACFAVYVGAVAIFAERGVWMMLLTTRSLALVFVMGPLAAVLGLQLAVCASSRVNDARTAQQLGALIIVLPIAALQIGQFLTGAVLTARTILAIALLLCAGNAILMSIAIRLFDRESILTRWK
jgi:ABC-2 type transport system permease protein